jgi:O-antigen/teichoic acid export membrane protein
MSLRRNIFANYANQFYSTVVGIVMVPVYVRYMGVEAYGLIGFFTMLQMWFQLLDVGLTPTMARETSRFRGGAVDALSLRRLLRGLECIFFGTAILGSCVMIVFADTVAGSWLQVHELPLVEVERAITLMALIVALRWVCGLYRGAISGFEHLVWLSGFNVLVSTARFVLVVPFLIFAGSSPTHFFSYQLGVALIEAVVLIIQTYRILPKIETGQHVTWQWQPLRGVLKFSLGIAFTNSMWVLVTQTDKLLLSTLLPLADYAYFTLAGLVASGVTVASSPISLALQPRLTKLSAEEDNAGLIELYRNATQLVGIISVSAAMILAFFSEQVLWAWTGDATMASKTAPVLTLYALGNGLVALGAFPYYLQFAKGDLKLHIVGNAIFSLLLIPGLIFATKQYGIIGAGYAWLCANVAYFLFWIPKVHDRFIKGLHFQWLLRDVGGIALLALVCAATAHWLLIWPEERVPVAAEIVLLALACLIIVAIASSWVRKTVSNKLHL